MTAAEVVLYLPMRLKLDAEHAGQAASVLEFAVRVRRQSPVCAEIDLDETCDLLYE